MRQTQKTSLAVRLQGFSASAPECVAFLEQRLQNDNYRGIQLSQHNRYNQDIILTIVEEIYKIAGKDLLQIRTTDLSKRPWNLPEEADYAILTTNINNKVDHCTQDSLRKNLFVDMHRMGLIKRYNAQQIEVSQFVGGIKKYISLTDFAERFMNEQNVFKRNMLYTRALETLLNGYGASLLGIMAELGTDYLTTEEMTLFTSYLDENNGSSTTTADDVVSYIKEFRQLGKSQRKAFTDVIIKYCDPKSFAGDKKQKRDWHNWINESQQIASLLGQTAYFEYDQAKGRLVLRLKNGLFNASSKLKRSLQVKQSYFEQHKIAKKKAGFELHHIVPLCWAVDANEFVTLDQWENLVYIDAYSHAQITQNRNRNVELDFNETNDTTIFKDYSNDNCVACKYGTNILYSKNRQQEMLSYNHKLLSATSDKHHKILDF